MQIFFLVEKLYLHHTLLALGNTTYSRKLEDKPFSLAKKEELYFCGNECYTAAMKTLHYFVNNSKVLKHCRSCTAKAALNRSGRGQINGLGSLGELIKE